MRSGRTVWLFLLLKLSLCLLCTVSVAAFADQSTAPSKPAYSNTALLNQMLAVDVSEQNLNNVPALSVTFSQHLEPTAEFDRFFTVTSDSKLLEGGWVLADNPRRLYFTAIQPDTTYRVQIRPGVPAANGMKLQKRGDFEVKTRDIKPAFDFASRGSILPAQLTDGLPVRVVNVPEVELEFLRVKPERLREVLQSMRLDHSIRSWELNDINAMTESVHTGRYITEARRNARETRLLPIESVAALKEPGLYFAVMRRPGHFTESAYRISHFVVTNIGLHVRLYDKKLAVFARELDSGQPLSGVQLTLHGRKESLQLETDQQGQAGFDHLMEGPLLLTAELGEQFAFLDLREAALDTSGYQVTGLPDKALSAFVFAARDLYRPGETVDLSVLLRNRDGLPETVNSLHVRIKRADGKVLREDVISAREADLGYFEYPFKLPDDGPTGRWTAEFRISSKDKVTAQTFEFHVEAFMPERMKLALSSDELVSFRGEKSIVAVQGDYLYGAPAAGNKLKATRVLSLDSHPLASFPDHYFGNPADEARLRPEKLKEQVLDEEGGAFLEIPPVASEISSALKMQVIASLSEPAGRVVTQTLDTAYWPAQNLVGVAPVFSGDTVDENSEARFEIIRVNADGELQAAENLVVTLVREERELFWEYNDQEGWTRKSVSQDYPLTQEKLTLVEGERGEVVFPVEYGRYRLEAEDPDTGLKTVYPFYAGWSEREQVSDKPDQLMLKLDKPVYRAGETVNLSVESDVAAEAVVTVEADALLWSELVSLKVGSNQFEVPVEADWARHDLYITVAAFRSASADRTVTPNRSVGIVHLPLDRSERRLELSLEAPEKVLPEKPVTVIVKAENLRGRKALVSLAAVDVGVLNITQFKTPDPWAFFFGQRRYGVDMHDDYGKVIESVDAESMRQRFGGGNAKKAGGVRVNPEVQVVALVNQAVAFDEEGRAELALAIPGFEGQLRLMAVAVSEEQMGSAEGNMLVASPVVSSLTGPRFLAVRDTSFLTVELNNVSDDEQVVKLGVTGNKLLNLVAVDREVTLASGQREVFKLPLSARDRFGVGHVRLKLEGQGFVANRHLELAIRPAYPALRKEHVFELQPGTDSHIPQRLVGGLLPSTLRGRLTLSNTPVLPVASALQGLLSFPYGCLEQTSSRAYPYLFLEADDAERWGLSPLAMSARNQQVQDALVRLSGMQLGSGAFTLWGSYGPPENWLTPYVVDFLLDARQQGFAVPERVLDKSLDYLAERLRVGRRTVTRGQVDNPAHLAVAGRAYSAYVLARAGRVSLGDLRNLLNGDIEQAVTGLPWVQLGLALVMQGSQQEGEKAIATGLAKERAADVWLGDYGSRVRDRAMMLYQILANKQSIPDLGAQVRQLTDLIHERSYLSTQEQVFVFLLGHELERRASGTWKAELEMDGEQVSLSQSGSFVHALTAENFKQAIRIRSEHDEPLYVNLAMQGHAEQAPAERNEPVSISRQWFALNGEEIVPQAVQLGDLLLTRLTLESSVAMNDALVVDMLPAGFEIENTHLIKNQLLQGLSLPDMSRTVTDALAEVSKNTEQFLDDRYMAAVSLRAGVKYHLFYLVRVVSAGDIAVPPPYVEDMYRPELFGIGKSVDGLSLRQQ